MAASDSVPVMRRALGLLAVACVVLQFGGSLAHSGLALSLWLAALALFKPGVLRRLWMPRFWLLTALFALGSGFLLGPRDWDLGPFRMSSEGLIGGIMMMVRGAFIFSLASWASSSLSGDGLRSLARRLGMGPLADAVGVALKLLPELSQRLVVARSLQPVGGRLRFVYGTAVDLITETARLAAEMSVTDGGDEPGLEFGFRLPVVAVVGEPDSGKTHTLGRVVEQLLAEGYAAGGVQQPKLMSEGRAQGYDLQDVASGARRSFARRCEDGEDPRVGFRFDEAGWTWAAEKIRLAATDADFLVVDELGWLEADGDGHGPALGSLPAQGRARFVLASVRAVCAASIEKRWGDFAFQIEAGADDAEIQVLVGKLSKL